MNRFTTKKTPHISSKLGLTILLLAVLSTLALASDAVQAAPLPMPAMTGPLQSPSPFQFNAGPLGKLDITGVVSGMGLWQDNPVNTVSPDPVAFNGYTHADISNGQIFIQKTHGLIQFFLQAGAYNMPAIGAPFISTGATTAGYYGPLPQAYLKIAPTKYFSVLIGKLPTLIGAEYTFTFENMNIERGLLWNQENAVNRGVMATYVQGPINASLSLNDGFYANRYSWVTGSLAYTLDKNNSLSFVAGGNTRQTARSSLAVPLLQNNSQIFEVIYTHLAGPWTLTPYLQYTRVPASSALGIVHAASTTGVALLANYAVDAHFSLASRAEYIGSTGSVANGAPSLLYGPGSQAWSLTFTPTYQNKLLFVRAELSYVQASGTTPGYALGPNFDSTSQSRVMLEAGLLF